MNWLEISVQVGDEETASVICDLFDRYGHGGAVQELTFLDTPTPHSTTVKAYLPLDADGEEKRSVLEDSLSRLADLHTLLAPRYKELCNEDWANAWKRWFQPQRIGPRLVFKLPKQDFSPLEQDIVIDLEPGMAFGTGLHATTRMCLILLQNQLNVGDRVLDMGTGSGILAIAAARLGAGAVLALDNDPVAVRVARENVSSNDLAGVVQVEEGSLARVAAVSGLLVDGITVNILAEVITAMMEEGLTAYLKPEGWLIAGGIATEAELEVRAALERCGLQVSSRSQAGDWVTLCGVRSRPAIASPAQQERTTLAWEEG